MHALPSYLCSALAPLAWACALLQDDSAAGYLVGLLYVLVTFALAATHLSAPFACSGLLELALDCIARASSRGGRGAADPQVSCAGAVAVCRPQAVLEPAAGRHSAACMLKQLQH